MKNHYLKLIKTQMTEEGNSETEQIGNQSDTESYKLYTVIRDDGRTIQKFDARTKADTFSRKLNRSYIESGLNTYSKVIELSEKHI